MHVENTVHRFTARIAVCIENIGILAAFAPYREVFVDNNFVIVTGIVRCLDFSIYSDNVAFGSVFNGLSQLFPFFILIECTSVYSYASCTGQCVVLITGVFVKSRRRCCKGNFILLVCPTVPGVISRIPVRGEAPEPLLVSTAGLLVIS